MKFVMTGRGPVLWCENTTLGACCTPACLPLRRPGVAGADQLIGHFVRSPCNRSDARESEARTYLWNGGACSMVQRSWGVEGNAEAPCAPCAELADRAGLIISGPTGRPADRPPTSSPPPPAGLRVHWRWGSRQAWQVENSRHRTTWCCRLKTSSGLHTVGAMEFRSAQGRLPRRPALNPPHVRLAVTAGR